ncbi:Imm1 family immunity protein [Plantactinospora sp. CA-290183]|uniref:Imm1 family immunity protein n=1 Tax=Plantactinospora sp. CA-290183 TaxID=3240006 RepID=UPI003D94E444
MKVTWSYDRADHRDSHEVEVSDPVALETLLRRVHEKQEPVVVTIYDVPDDEDDLPTGLQVGLGHPTHAFVVHIADDGGYLIYPDVPAPSEGIAFDVGGVRTEYPAEHLRVQPDFALRAAATFLRTGKPPTPPERTAGL